MNTASTFNPTANYLANIGNPSVFVFEELNYFDCFVNGKLLSACIYAHEILLQNFGFWVSFSDGSHFLMCTDTLLTKWVTLVPGGNIYADAIQEKLDQFLDNNCDKLSTVCTW